MNRLTEQQKRILEAITATPGLSLEQLAERFGTSKNVVKVQIHNIRDAMIGTGSEIVSASGYVLRADA